MNIAALRRLLVVGLPAIAAAFVAAMLVVIVLKPGSDDEARGACSVAGGGAIAPRICDHWHAVYAIFIGDIREPNIPTFTGPEEIHTHGDGIIHMHPFISAGEGPGAAIGKFFQYGGGTLSSGELRIPGQRETYKNRDKIPGSNAMGALRILRADSGIHPLRGFGGAIAACDAKPKSEFEVITPAYIPQDGDCIRIVFGPN